MKWALSLVLLVGALPLSTHNSAYAHSALGTQHSVLVEEQSVEADFPESVEFRLRASGFETARAELNYRLVGDPVTAGMQADLEEATSTPDLEVMLDLTTDYIPPGTQLEYYWTLTDEEGNTAETPVETFKLVDEQYPWKSLTDAQDRVTVNWYEGGSDFGKTLLSVATGALDRLQNDIDAGLTRPAEIWVYASQDELLDALPANIPEWVGGKAFPELALVMAAIGDDEYAELETKRTIPHELSHLVLYQATRNPYNAPPAWLDEGLAVYSQEAHDPAEEETLRWAAENGALVPLNALSGSFGADEESALLGYAQSHSAVEFLLTDSRYGPDKLARTVAAFREGVTYDEAFVAGLGVTVEEIDEQWRASLPYEVVANNSATLTRSIWDLLVWVAAAVGLLLFTAGGIVTAIIVLRRRRSTSPQPPIMGL
ncbi:MAG: peptidase MA family metallohydrolase [Chloroflexota bacterium]|nr:peptidase MA family metallohydrolase [Chloroflexota bacterium]